MNAISSAFRAGLVEENASRGCGWNDVRSRVESMLEKVNNATTLFLGAAASSFIPTSFPGWEKFIEIVYSSLIDEATYEIGRNDIAISDSLKQCIAEALDWNNPRRVPNYRFTEVIARRLGKDYLRLLRAFGTQKNDDQWVVNEVHKWAATCLMDGSVSAVVTTNFDDCIEKALCNAEANTYLLTGNPHIDGVEITSRTQKSSGKLILIVNGPEACRFAQSLLPQLGKSVSLLFKLHGSCYVPETCIDTRLQRQQGLPSYAIDILDTLLVRSVFFVACFSGSDLNDNTDYLRMVHNKRDVRLVWLQTDFDKIERGLRALCDSLQTDSHASEGLCLLHGSMRGEQINWDEEPSDFKEVIVDWCKGLGSHWCKLTVLDLIALCGGTESQSSALERLGFSGGKRQDWNRILEELSQLEDQEQVIIAKPNNSNGDVNDMQFAVAEECKNAAEMVQNLLESDLNEEQRVSSINLVYDQCLKIKQWHLGLANSLSTDQPHAQSWVISALYGLLLFCGKQQQAAGEALSFAQNAAYLVGDLQPYFMIEELMGKLGMRRNSSQLTVPEHDDTSSVIAFVPSLDNVSAKANLYGVPPALFLRALLHRAILFADKIAIPSNVLANSSVFLNEVLFSGGDEANEFYLSFLYPVVPRPESYEQNILTEYRRKVTKRGHYILEKVADSQLEKLDAYFESFGVGNRFMFYSIANIADNYNKYLLRAVSERKTFTRTYLMDHWEYTRNREHSSASGTESPDNEELAADMTDTIIHVVELFMQNLKDPVDRSKLYTLAGLKTVVTDDQEAILKHLKDGTDSRIRDSLASGRQKILERPWISGPLCHELFDVPYRCNLLLHLTEHSTSANSIMFLEEHEMSSWKLMAGLLENTQAFEINGDAVSLGQVSALLLGQASERDLSFARDALAPVRGKLATNEQLDVETRELIARELVRFKMSSVDVEDKPISEIAALSDQSRELMKDFLSHCVFLVRKGEALDRMYEEPQFTLPGALRLKWVSH